MDYVHITSSNTDRGTQFSTLPQMRSGVPLFVDASSDFLTRAVEWDKVSLLYATSHKNLGTAGVCVVVMRRDLRPCARHLPSFASLDAWREAESMLNTPVTGAVHVLRLMLQWCLSMGGLAALEERSRIRADRVYTALDTHAATFAGLARPDSRSRVSITFRLENEAQEQAFTEHARTLGLHGLAGYRLCGHLRACLFNAVPDEGVEALVTAIETFGTTLAASDAPRKDVST